MGRSDDLNHYRQPVKRAVEVDGRFDRRTPLNPGRSRLLDWQQAYLLVVFI